MTEPDVYKREYVKGRGRGVIAFERSGGEMPEQSSFSDEVVRAIYQGVVYRIWNDSTADLGPGEIPKMNVEDALVNEEPWGVTSDQLAPALHALGNTTGKPRCIDFPETTEGDIVGKVINPSSCKGCIFALATYGNYWECTLEDVQPLGIMEILRKNLPNPVRRGKDNQPRLSKRNA